MKHVLLQPVIPGKLVNGKGVEWVASATHFLRFGKRGIHSGSKA
ncbi:hypothetical protein [Psychrobacillus psychrotolerans]|nr:hypothetical protein [Psychrobacillus psychrotolerans]